MNNKDINSVIKHVIRDGEWTFPDFKNMSQSDFENYLSVAISAVINSSSFKSHIKNLID